MTRIGLLLSALVMVGCSGASTTELLIDEAPLRDAGVDHESTAHYVADSGSPTEETPKVPVVPDAADEAESDSASEADADDAGSMADDAEPDVAQSDSGTDAQQCVPHCSHTCDGGSVILTDGCGHGVMATISACASVSSIGPDCLVAGSSIGYQALLCSKLYITCY